MEEKIKIVEDVIQGLGLSSQKVADYLIGQGKVKQALPRTKVEQENQQNVENCSVANPKFPEDDVRSRTQLFWYAFEGKNFSPDPYAYPNCQGVVGWINSNIDAPEGDRVYVVLPEQEKMFFSEGYYNVGTNKYDGRRNTKDLIEFGKKRGVKFQAAEYAYNYTKNGVKKGEAFLPAEEQLNKVIYNYVGVRKALRLIGGTFEGWLMSSSEIDHNNVWEVKTQTGRTFDPWGGTGNLFYPVARCIKHELHTVSCFLAY